MEPLIELKAILHSKRANLYYLEHCKIQQKDGRVVYLSEANKRHQYFNIPIGNTTCLLLGTGTSITQAAVRNLAQAGVLLGFCGGGGTPLLMAQDIEWLSPQNEYRPTEYMQGWLSFWFNDAARLDVAKQFQLKRIEYLKHIWGNDRPLKEHTIYIDDPELAQPISRHQKAISCAQSVNELLSNEAVLTKCLYKYIAQHVNYGDFIRERDSEDKANAYLNHGNYLTYGLAATALWVLGIPHGFAVMHGKTRRGALVFDVADLVKDALILPLAFIYAQQDRSEQEFRQACLNSFANNKALDFMFNCIKEQATATVL